jgi:hypothetical protein
MLVSRISIIVLVQACVEECSSLLAEMVFGVMAQWEEEMVEAVVLAEEAESAVAVEKVAVEKVARAENK